ELAPGRRPAPAHLGLRLLRIPAAREQPERRRREHRDQHEPGLTRDRGPARTPLVRGHQHPVRRVHPAVLLVARLHPTPGRDRAHGPAHGPRVVARGRGAPLRWTMEIERVKEKILEGRPGFPRQYGPQRADHQPGIPLFPQEATRDRVTVLLFLDRGRETRPAKAPIRSAVGVAGIASIFTSSLYSIREVVAQRWVTPNGAALIPDGTMKWFFIIPPVLVGLTTYIALRRLAYQPMRISLLPYVAGLTLVGGAQIAWIFLT